jgi:hypothetical protein
VLAACLSADNDGPLTVKRAIVDYLDDYRRRGAEGAEVIEGVVGRNVLPALGLARNLKRAVARLINFMDAGQS